MKTKTSEPVETNTTKPSGVTKPKLNFSALTQASSSKPKAKSYPLYPADDNSKALVDAILETDEQIKSAEAANIIAKNDLIELVLPWWLNQGTGRTGVAGSVLVGGTVDTAITVFKDQYTKTLTDLEPLAAIMGETLVEEMFTQRFKIEIDSDKVPADKLQLVIDAVHQVATQLGVGEAISIKPFTYPLPGFNAARHVKLSVEQNLALEQVIPGKRYTTISIGRKR